MPRQAQSPLGSRQTADGIWLTPVQAAVLEGCCIHQRSSFMHITPSRWYCAPPPFAGGPQAFASHLRALQRRGLLHRKLGTAAEYSLTGAGEKEARARGFL